MFGEDGGGFRSSDGTLELDESDRLVGASPLNRRLVLANGNEPESFTPTDFLGANLELAPDKRGPERCVEDPDSDFFGLMSARERPHLSSRTQCDLGFGRDDTGDVGDFRFDPDALASVLREVPETPRLLGVN